MSPTITRVGAIVRKEFLHLRRDPRMVIAVLVMPIVQLLLFAYAISFDVTDVPTVVVDSDRSPASRAYIDAYRASEFFDVRGEVADIRAVDGVFQRGEARIAVVVPAGTEASIQRGEKASVAVLVDGSEPNEARIGAGYANALNQAYGRELAFAWADRTGVDMTRSGVLEPRLRTWYNPERSSSIFLIPGLIVVIIMIVTVQQTAVTLVRERIQGTQEQMAVSPLRPLELMVGKLLPWTLLAFVDVVAITAVGMAVFGVPLRGSITLFVIASVVFVFAALAMGLIVSAVSPSMEVANIGALLLSFLPAFLLSGFAFPLESIPAPLQWLSYAFPGRYMVSISRGVFLKGAGLEELWPITVQLAGYAAVLLLVAVMLHRRRAR